VHCYCTYFDSHYLARGMVMLRSLLRWDPTAALYVLALDDLCARVLARTFRARVAVVDAGTLYAREPALAARRGGRSTWAFYATHKPVLVRYLLGQTPQPALTFIDADTWFFADPAPMFAEIAAASIALTPHRFDPASLHLAIYGTYNAGCITWANDATALACVSDWRAQCLAWCEEATLPDGRFMNQGYLDAWPQRYGGVHVVRHPGVNLAPWNVDGHSLACSGRGIDVDGAPLVFYHFSGLVRDARGRWFSIYPHPVRQRALAHDALYAPYIAAVEAEAARLMMRYAITGIGSVRDLALGPHAVALPVGRPR
jgi:hypothetical protein